MITYVPQSIKDAAVSHPDWPEIEAAMKRAYGDDWRLVSYEEPMHPAEGRGEEQKMTEYIEKGALIDWLMPYVHLGDKVDPDSLIEDIREMKAADLERRVDELEAELRDSDGADAERLGEFAEEVIRQFAYRIKTNGQCAFTAGGLSVLEEAFDIVGWDDPHLCPECECEEDGCHEWATGGMPTPDGYKWLCSRHREVYQAREETERDSKEADHEGNADF